MRVDWEGRSRLVNGLYQVHDCPKCNYNEIINWHRFCPWCGRKVTWLNAEELMSNPKYAEELNKVEIGAIGRLLKRITKRRNK